MTRAGAYGQSFALELLGRGKLVEALAAADEAAARSPEDPEPVLDRAQIHLAAERYEAAIADVEKARALDAVAMVLDDSVIDDTAFTALVRWAQAVAAKDAAAAVAIMKRYEQLAPDGATHADEAAGWIRRFQGEKQVWSRDTGE